MDTLELRDRGIEIRETEDIGALTKFLPARMLFQDAIIVTADDDNFYWMGWLKELVLAWSGSDNHIVCHRAHRILFEENGLPRPYVGWEYETLAKYDRDLFPTGCMGVMYPPNSLHPTVCDAEQYKFMRLTNDDIWLYWMAQLAHSSYINLSSVGDGRRKQIQWPGTQEQCLARTNIPGGNDVQIASMVNAFGWPSRSRAPQVSTVRQVERETLDASGDRPGDSQAAELDFILKKYCGGKRFYLEWGCGEGTAVLVEHARATRAEFVLCMDHEEHRLRTTEEKVGEHHFLHFRHVPSEETGASQDEQWRDYAAYPSLADVKFDFIHINGDRQVECALWAAHLLADDGIVVLHDYRRRRYDIMGEFLDCVGETSQFRIFRGRRAAGTPLPAAAAKKDGKRAIVVPLAGPFARREWREAESSVAAYAQRIGAELLPVNLDPHGFPQFLKHAAVAAACAVGDFDRLLLLDADVLIRDHCPDLFAHVPSDRIGAFFEGRIFDRSGDWSFAQEAYGALGVPVRSGDYFNTGVFVMSRKHYGLFDYDKLPPKFYGHPENEQTFLNWLCAEQGLKTFDIGQEFNLFPGFPEFGGWRRGWILHFAGGVPRRMLTHHAWRSVGIRGDTEVHQRVPISPKAMRPYWMVESRHIVAGRPVTLVLPPELAVTNGRIEFTADGGIRYSSVGPDGAMLFYGPYISLARGAYRFACVGEDGGPSTFGIEMIARAGEKKLAPYCPHRVVPGEWNWVHVTLDEDENDVEFRGFGLGEAVSFAYIFIERLVVPPAA